MEGHALRHRERDVREAGHDRHDGEPAGVPDDGVRHDGRQRRHAAEPLVGHRQPGAAPRRLPQRLLPGPLRHHRARLHRLLPRHDHPHPHRRRAGAPPAPPRRRALVAPDGRAPRLLRAARRRRRRHPPLQPRLRRRPVRPAHPVGAPRHQQLLQLVLLHLHHRHDGLRHAHHLPPEQRQLGAGARRAGHAHGPLLRALLHGHAPLRPRPPRGQPLHQLRAGPRRRRAQAPPPRAAVPRRRPLRPAAPPGQHRLQDRIHAPVPLPRQGRHSHRRRRREPQPLAPLLAAAGGGGQVPGAAAPRLVRRHRLLHRAHQPRQLQRAPGHADGPPRRRRRLPDPRGLLRRLQHAGAHALAPLLRRRARPGHAARHRPRRRHHPAAADRRRHRPLHRHHARRRRRRGTPPQGRRHGLLLPARPAADAGGALRGLRRHRTGRLLLQAVPGEHAQRRRRAPLPGLRHRQLRQRPHGQRRAPDHRRPRRPPRLAGAGPQPGTRRPLLPAHRRHGRRQPRLLRHLRALVQVQEAGSHRRRRRAADGGQGRSASCLNA